MLEVFADFDRFGGASMELVAWELFVDRQQLQAAWAQAVAEKQLMTAGRDEDGDQMWRLTLRGRTAMATDPEEQRGRPSVG